MAITRRQFVARLGALASAVGISQTDLTKLTEAFAHGDPFGATKPKVIWVHGAECTGCSTSVLGLFEDVRGTAIEGGTTTTLQALDLALGGTGSTVADHRTLDQTGFNVDGVATGTGDADSVLAVNIADILVDIIDLQYHETVMGMGGDLAYQWLKDARDSVGDTAFVLVVEGAVQAKTNTGTWNSAGDVSWCAIGKDGDTASSGEHDFAATVLDLATRDACVAVVPIGQCATYGGYPGAKVPAVLDASGAQVNAVAGISNTGAQGVYDFLSDSPGGAQAKVINVPGCPINPWWLVLTLVAWLVDFVNIPAVEGATGPLGVLKYTGGKAVPNGAAIDAYQRLKAVYNASIHGGACPRYPAFLQNKFATRPGAAGCLKLIGCKGVFTKSTCGLHGWNGQQRHNDLAWDQGVAAINVPAGASTPRGGHCTTAGAPCMACTEAGYPDSFVPFVRF